MLCPWCDEPMVADGDGNMTCPYECQDECLTCGRTIGDCGPDECAG